MHRQFWLLFAILTFVLLVSADARLDGSDDHKTKPYKRPRRSGRISFSKGILIWQESFVDLKLDLRNISVLSMKAILPTTLRLHTRYHPNP